MFKANDRQKQSNIELRVLAAHVGDLEIDECEAHRAEILEAVNAATAQLPEGRPLAGEHFDEQTPIVPLLRALGTLATMVPPPYGPASARFAA